MIAMALSLTRIIIKTIANSFPYFDFKQSRYL
jgi:hypothetical protein